MALFHNAALQSGGDCMSSIVDAKFGEDTRNAALDGRLCNEQPVGDLLIGILTCDQLQNLNFAWAQHVTGGEFGGDFRRISLLSFHDRMNSLD